MNIKNLQLRRFKGSEKLTIIKQAIVIVPRRWNWITFEVVFFRWVLMGLRNNSQKLT